MTAGEIISKLQEEPAGRPWESEAVRTWEPAPFDMTEYENFFYPKPSHKTWAPARGKALPFGLRDVKGPHEYGLRKWNIAMGRTNGCSTK